MKPIKLIALLFICVACAGSGPVKNYTVIRYLCAPGCLEWIDQDDNVHEICPEDEGYPKDIACQSILDMNKELNFQDKLRNACKKWK